MNIHTRLLKERLLRIVRQTLTMRYASEEYWGSIQNAAFFGGMYISEVSSYSAFELQVPAYQVDIFLPGLL